jgi:hypothetical protein
VSETDKTVFSSTRIKLAISYQLNFVSRRRLSPHVSHAALCHWSQTLSVLAPILTSLKSFTPFLNARIAVAAAVVAAATGVHRLRARAAVEVWVVPAVPHPRHPTRPRRLTGLTFTATFSSSKFSNRPLARALRRLRRHLAG